MSQSEEKSRIKNYREYQLNLFLDMLYTYNSNYPYLVFNCKTFIESCLKGLDFELIMQTGLYDIDYTLKFLKEKKRIADTLISKITELSNYIRKLESGKLEINYDTTKQVVIETSLIMLEILHFEELYNIDNNDPASAIYQDKARNNINEKFKQISSIINNTVKQSDEEVVIDIIGPVYFYSSGELSIGRTKRAIFVDIENATIVSNPVEETFERRDSENEDVLKVMILTQSAKTITLYIWRRWKQFKDALKEGEKISLLGVAVKNFPDFVEVHLLEKSLLIIKPDILINATTIANVIQGKKVCLNKHLLSLKDRNLSDNSASLKGIMIGELIDDFIIQGEEFSFDESFKKHYRDKLHKAPFIKDGFEPHKIYRQIIAQIQSINIFVWNVEKPVYEKPQYIEPFYISPHYGLEGRMDMMYIDKEKKSIRLYELKSGKAPSSNYPPWDNHSYQTFCYKLVLDSVYEYKDLVPYLLYSSSENPIRTLDYDLTAETIEARNLIITFIDKLIDENVDRQKFLELHKSAMCMNCPSYMESKCKSDYQLFSSTLSINEFDYYIGFFKLLEREKQQSYFLTSHLWKKTLSEREASFTAISELSIETITGNNVIFNISKENASDIRVGDNVFIHRGNPLKEEIFRGSVINLKKNYIIVNIHKNLPVNISSTGWCIDRAYSTSGTDAQHSGLYKFIKSNQHLKDLILGNVKPSFRKRLDKSVKIDDTLNLNQQKAFELCLKAKDYALIQGPPGTGKTYTIASIIKQFVDEGKKVLITAYTNRSVDNILKTLINKFNYKAFLRIGSIFNIDPDILPYTIDTLVEKYDIDEGEQLKSTILSYQVFACTTTSAVTTLIFDNIKFDVVIVDEAGQMTEPSTLTVIEMGEKFLLFGDDKQLPPIVTDESLKNAFSNNEYLTKIGLSNLRKSLFERLWKLNKKWEQEDSNFQSTITLNIQYRMNRQIADISANFFYNDIIISDKVNESYTIADLGFKLSKERVLLNEILSSELSVCFIDCVDNKISKENKTEADIVYNIVYNFLSGGIKPEHIGVIAPYKAQCALIRKLIDTIPSTIADASDVIVDTVERYQGGEKEIIIVSFTVGDENMLNFLSENNEDPLLNRKLNVSITRAKRKLIMLGNVGVLKKDKVYRQLIYYLESKRCLFTYKME